MYLLRLNFIKFVKKSVLKEREKLCLNDIHVLSQRGVTDTGRRRKRHRFMSLKWGRVPRKIIKMISLQGTKRDPAVESQDFLPL